MLRLLIAAVLVSACLAYPQKKDGAPAEAANLQGFNQGMPAMPNMQGMQGMQAMPAMPMMGMQGQFLPFNPNFGGMGYKRDLDENLEARKHHSKFNEDNKFRFGSEHGLRNFMDFMNNDNNLPFGNMDSADTDLGNFQPSAENDEGKFRFFDQQQ
uniref:Conotoxin B2 superfamily protein n=1 Tax=Conus amadis TaxID=198732 RepID=A0AA50AAA1_CONAA|nr:conotoxin precursor B2 superfamily protein [Conus amadis]